MQFIVDTKSGKITLTSNALVETLLAKVIEKSRDDFVSLSVALVEILQKGSTLGAMSIDQILTTGLALGYFYRVFLDKNIVVIEEDNVDELGIRDIGSANSESST